MIMPEGYQDEIEAFIGRFVDEIDPDGVDRIQYGKFLTAAVTAAFPDADFFSGDIVS